MDHHCVWAVNFLYASGDNSCNNIIVTVFRVKYFWIFFIMHATLVSGNTTTTEAYEKKTSQKWRYGLGRKRNFEQVFGTLERHWFIPAYSEEDLRRMLAL
ncbi:putative protein S-acyltransferase [Helianthus anomalus]